MDSTLTNETKAIAPSQKRQFYFSADCLPLWLIAQFVGVASVLGRDQVSMFDL